MRLRLQKPAPVPRPLQSVTIFSSSLLICISPVSSNASILLQIVFPLSLAHHDLNTLACQLLLTGLTDFQRQFLLAQVAQFRRIGGFYAGWPSDEERIEVSSRCITLCGFASF